MKKLYEYKVSENIINTRIKELAFIITKKITSVINLKTFDLNRELELYYNFNTNELYEYTPSRLINFNSNDLKIKLISNKDVNFLGMYNFLDKLKIHQITINIYNIDYVLDLNVNNESNYKKTYLYGLYRIVFHELRHYFDEIENINKTSNKYLDNLHSYYNYQAEIIKELTVVINKDIIYYLSDQEIRGNSINYYIFGRCRYDYTKTNIDRIYQNIESNLTNNEEYLYKNINDIVYNDGISIDLLNILKPIFTNIKENRIINDFNKLYTYVELKDFKNISFILRKIFKRYWEFLKTQITKAKFTFEIYYKKGFNNEKFK